MRHRQAAVLRGGQPELGFRPLAEAVRMRIRPSAAVPVAQRMAVIQPGYDRSQHGPLHLVRRLPLEPFQPQHVGVEAVRHHLLAELATIEQGRHPLAFLPFLAGLGRDLPHHAVSRFRQVLPLIFLHLFPQAIIAVRPAFRRRATQEHGTKRPQDNPFHSPMF